MVSRPSGKQRHLHVSNEDRKWAGNYAIQATTDANIVSIEISYCKSERFAHVMGIPQDIPQNLKAQNSRPYWPDTFGINRVKRTISVKYLGRLFKILRRNLIHPCTLDRPLTC